MVRRAASPQRVFGPCRDVVSGAVPDPELFRARERMPRDAVWEEPNDGPNQVRSTIVSQFRFQKNCIEVR